MHKCFQPVEGEFQFAQYGNSNVLDEIQELLEASVKASCEGLMVKMLDTAESGYEPSMRSRNWLKVWCLLLISSTVANFYTGQKGLPRRCW
jgi:DNA ligase-1